MGSNRKHIFIVIGMFFLVSLLVGWLTPEPMIGDEVTHYYMLAEQSRDLTTPNFQSVIPVGYGDPVERQYAHSFGWHYFGALVYRVSGGRYFAVQLYHGMFWIQLLVACFLLAASRNGEKNGVSILYTVLIGSLPMCILFSVALYQEIPVTAQIVTGFLLLSTGHWLAAIFFMAFALLLKVSAFVAFPVFFVLLIWRVWHHGLNRRSGECKSPIQKRFLRSAMAALVALLVLGGASWGLGWSLQKHANADFYPVIAARRISQHVSQIAQDIFTRNVEQQMDTHLVVDPTNERRMQAEPPARGEEKIKKSRPAYDVIAHHPGDLRFPRNWALYFGGVFWMAVALGLLGWGRQTKRGRTDDTVPSAGWLWAAGVGYLLPTAYILRTAPDARFFLPAIPFLLLPLCEKAAYIPFRKWVFTGLISVGVLQSGAVYWKTYQLRNVSDGIYEAINFLEENMPSPPRVFMYPEGNYRLFPTDHEWYLNYGLRDFWSGDNDFRIQMLNRRRVGAIVVKKHLVAPIDSNMHNLGVYPPEFVQDLKNDPRFVLLLNNANVLIFRVPTFSESH